MHVCFKGNAVSVEIIVMTKIKFAARTVVRIPLMSLVFAHTLYCFL